MVDAFRIMRRKLVRIDAKEIIEAQSGEIRAASDAHAVLLLAQVFLGGSQFWALSFGLRFKVRIERKGCGGVKVV